MIGELLLEIGTEEIPAGFLSPALEGMEKTLRNELESQRLQFDNIVTMGTPRRLVLCVQGMVERQADTVLEAMGPPEKVAFDDAGNPTKAAASFAEKQGVSVDELTVAETKKADTCIFRKRLKERKLRRYCRRC